MKYLRVSAEIKGKNIKPLLHSWDRDEWKDILCNAALDNYDDIPDQSDDPTMYISCQSYAGVKVIVVDFALVMMDDYNLYDDSMIWTDYVKDYAGELRETDRNSLAYFFNID